MIDTLISHLAWIGATTLSPFWLPVVVWTGVATGIHWFLQKKQELSPHLGFALYQGIYWALPAGIVLGVLGDLVGAELATRADPISLSSAQAGEIISTGPKSSSVAAGSSASWQLKELVLPGVGMATVGMLGGALWSLLRLAASAQLLRGLIGFGLVRSADDELRQIVDETAVRMNVGRSVDVCLGMEQSVPITYGLRRPVIVIPAHLQGKPEAMRMVIAHELVHIRRVDYLQRGAELLWAGLLAFHPFVQTVRDEIDTYREMCCDEEVLRQTQIDHAQYARLLYETARQELPTEASLPLSRRSSQLKRRIQAMTDSSGASSSQWWNRYGVAFGSAAALLMSIVVGCSTTLGPAAPSTLPTSSVADQPAKTAPDSAIFVAVEQMPKLIGGRERLRNRISYPASARQAGMEGQVVVFFTVTPEGETRGLRLASGPEGPLAKEVFQAVQKARFKPGTQRGKGVPVDLLLPVQFSLAGPAQTPDPLEVGKTIDTDVNTDISVHPPGSVDSNATTDRGVITGRVVDAEGEPLTGANVQVVDTRFGATPGADGRYQIKYVSPGQVTLRFSYVGYYATTVEHVPVKKAGITTVDVQIARQVTQLPGIAVTAE